MTWLHFAPHGRRGVILGATNAATLQLVSLVADESRADRRPGSDRVVLAIDESRPVFIDCGDRFGHDA